MANHWNGGDRLILTVAHCTDHSQDHKFIAVVGDHDTSADGANEQVFEVEKYVFHPNFRSKLTLSIGR